jgi:methylphosphotriester-DNA--protein-cysteine methyltransferase
MHENQCAVCDRIATANNTVTVSVMTDGITSRPVCDTCRPSVTAVFFVYGSIYAAVAELRAALSDAGLL